MIGMRKGANYASGQTYRLENNLPAPGISCDGEPAPDREFEAMMPGGLMALGNVVYCALAKGIDEEGEIKGSTGDTLVAGEVERSCPADRGA